MKIYHLVLLIVILQLVQASFSRIVANQENSTTNFKMTKTLYVKHPLHNVDNHPNTPTIIKGVIQITEGSSGKLELDEQTGLLKLDRVLAMPVVFPINYGFVPKSLGQDNDPLDVMVISSFKIPPLTIVDVRVLGVMRMFDSGETDDKILGVPDKDPLFSHYIDLIDVPKTTINKIIEFFQVYKKLDNKIVIVDGFNNRTAAFLTIVDCQKRYENYKNN